MLTTTPIAPSSKPQSPPNETSSIDVAVYVLYGTKNHFLTTVTSPGRMVMDERSPTTKMRHAAATAATAFHPPASQARTPIGPPPASGTPQIENCANESVLSNSNNGNSPVRFMLANVGIERPPSAVRPNDGLGEMVAGETGACKRHRGEQHHRSVWCTAAEAVA